ncbi:hypothetical protein SNE40_010825 [Patella caerulea]|uniref:PiggyBac transposable element-derived protein domain-containing protein n=1 Tax=Patella caerulea TaxID=87958 RepID=A0AAN8K1S2_PATCE
MMVLYKGKYGNIKQYIKSKPHKWGFKPWVRCGDEGFMYDFQVYLGKTTNRATAR